MRWRSVREGVREGVMAKGACEGGVCVGGV